MKSIFFVCAYLLTAALGLYAQETTNDGVETFRIRAKREVFDPKKTSLNTTIITSEEIDASGANNVAEALQFIPGLAPRSTGGISIRGITADQTIILINGQRINTAQGEIDEGIDLRLYSVANIERIEVIKGAAATRYGADAVGGVINIITKERAESIDGVDSTIRYGSFNTMSANTLISKSFGENNQGSVVIDGGVHYSDGKFPYDTNVYGANGAMLYNESFRGNARVGVNYNINDTDKIYGSISGLVYEKGGSFVYDPNSTFSIPRKYEGQSYLANIGYEIYSLPIFNIFINANSTVDLYKVVMGPNLNIDESLYENYAAEASFALQAENDLGSTSILHDIEILYRNDYLSFQHDLVGNVENVHFEDGENVQRNTISIAYLPTFNILKYDGTDVARLTIEPSIRFDTIINSGAKTNDNYYEPTYSIGALYTFDTERRYIVKGNFNYAYALPNFNDLYFDSIFSFGNPNLKKESSLGGDVGFIIQPIDILSFAATYYVENIDDMIYWISMEDGVTRAINVGEVFLQGAEASFTLNVPIEVIYSAVALTGSYAYQYSRASGEYVAFDPITFVPSNVTFENTKLPGAPEHSASGVLSYIFNGIGDLSSARLNFAVNYVGPRFATVNGNQDEFILDEFITYDITAYIEILDSITIEGGVKNIADTRYEYNYNRPLPGREWYVGLSGRF